jgi:dienelactone hydrolase
VFVIHWSCGTLEPGWDRVAPPFETVDPQREPAILDGHVAHLRAALNWLAGQCWTDENRAAVAGWSYGGESAVRLAMAESGRVQLLIGMSASGLTAAPYAGAAFT